MSPFATSLKELRHGRGLKQQQVADLVGCSRIYVAQIEVDMKPVPSEQFVHCVAEKLGLDEAESAELLLARTKSARRYEVPAELSRAAYELVWLFHKQLDQLNGAQIRLITEALTIREGDPKPQERADPDRPIRRSDHGTRKKETAM